MKVLIKWPSNFYSVFKVYRELLTRSNIIECFANEAILRYNITNKQTIFYQTLNQQNKLVFSGLRTRVMLVTLCYSSQNTQVTFISKCVELLFLKHDTGIGIPLLTYSSVRFVLELISTGSVLYQPSLQAN